ncbi:MAG TPA: hypothetical protein VFO38_00100 [Candidatus Saccharimonadales bacterium]|nr:hypothetical protein [Candidatus Saccharimonadales bacterium]
MEPNSSQNTLRSLLIYVLIGGLLLAGVVLGMRWAKGRSDQIATQQSQPQTQSPSPQEPEKKPEPSAPQPVTAPQPSTQQPSAEKPLAQSAPTVAAPSHVPATGAEDIILPIFALAATMFAAVNYMQSRRRLIEFK